VTLEKNKLVHYIVVVSGDTGKSLQIEREWTCFARDSFDRPPPSLVLDDSARNDSRVKGLRSLCLYTASVDAKIQWWPAGEFAAAGEWRRACNS
jgi:hypothetical protein